MTELTRVGILRAGKVGAILYSFLGVLFVPFALIAAVSNPGEGSVILLMLVFYPLMGFLGCMLGAALYNLTVKIGGGLLLEFEQVVDTREPAGPQNAPYGPPEQSAGWTAR